jgi:hypothetical protein
MVPHGLPSDRRLGTPVPTPGLKVMGRPPRQVPYRRIVNRVKEVGLDAATNDGVY